MSTERGEMAPAGTCTRPPMGWYCTLAEGHDGPCPTHPTNPESWEEAAKRVPWPTGKPPGQAVLDAFLARPLSGTHTGADSIVHERLRQRERWTEEHDDTHTDGQLAACALHVISDYLADRGQTWVLAGGWPMQRAIRVSAKYRGNYRARLAIAGALVAAEMDRLDRAGNKLLDFSTDAMSATAEPEPRKHRWPRNTASWTGYRCLDCGTRVEESYEHVPCPGPAQASYTANHGITPATIAPPGALPVAVLDTALGWARLVCQKCGSTHAPTTVSTDGVVTHQCQTCGTHHTEHAAPAEDTRTVREKHAAKKAGGADWQELLKGIRLTWQEPTPEQKTAFAASLSRPGVPVFSMESVAGIVGAVERFVRRMTADPDGAIDWSTIGAWFEDFARQAEWWRDAHAGAWKLLNELRASGTGEPVDVFDVTQWALTERAGQAAQELVLTLRECKPPEPRPGKVYLVTRGSGEDGDEWGVVSIHTTRRGADAAKKAHDEYKNYRPDGSFYHLLTNEVEEWDTDGAPTP